MPTTIPLNDSPIHIDSEEDDDGPLNPEPNSGLVADEPAADAAQLVENASSSSNLMPPTEPASLQAVDIRGETHREPKTTSTPRLEHSSQQTTPPATASSLQLDSSSKSTAQRAAPETHRPGSAPDTASGPDSARADARPEPPETVGKETRGPRSLQGLHNGRY